MKTYNPVKIVFASLLTLANVCCDGEPILTDGASLRTQRGHLPRALLQLVLGDPELPCGVRGGKGRQRRHERDVRTATRGFVRRVCGFDVRHGDRSLALGTLDISDAEAGRVRCWLPPVPPVTPPTKFGSPCLKPFCSLESAGSTIEYTIDDTLVYYEGFAGGAYFGGVFDAETQVLTHVGPTSLEVRDALEWMGTMSMDLWAGLDPDGRQHSLVGGVVGVACAYACAVPSPISTAACGCALGLLFVAYLES